MNPKIFWRAPNLCKEESMWLKKQVSRVTKKSCNVVSSKHPFVCSLNMSYIIKLEIVNFYLKLTQVAAILCLLFKIILSKRGGGRQNYILLVSFESLLSHFPVLFWSLLPTFWSAFGFTLKVCIPRFPIHSYPSARFLP